MTWRLTTIAALVLLAAVACSRREEGAMGEPVQGDERGFVESSASSGMLEMKLGEYAVANANSEPVRDFARKMIEDHGRANQTLEIAAQAQQLNYPDAMLKLHEDTYKELTQLSGPQFDLAYVQAMVEGARAGRRGAACRDRARAGDAGRSVGLGHPAHGASAPRARPRARGPGRPGGAAVPVVEARGDTHRGVMMAGHGRLHLAALDRTSWLHPFSSLADQAARDPLVIVEGRGARCATRPAAGTWTRWRASGA